jgi:hypothetical protein
LLAGAVKETVAVVCPDPLAVPMVGVPGVDDGVVILLLALLLELLPAAFVA